MSENLQFPDQGVRDRIVTALSLILIKLIFIQNEAQFDKISDGLPEVFSKLCFFFCSSEFR